MRRFPRHKGTVPDGAQTDQGPRRVSRQTSTAPVLAIHMGSHIDSPHRRGHMLSDRQTIMDALRRIVQALRQSSAHSEQSSNVTGAQALILKHVAAREGLSINELAGLTFTHQSTVSEVVSRLESRGLVQRTRAQDDGRKCELRLTDDGRAATRSTTITAQEKLMQALQDLPPDTIAQLAHGLEALIDAAGLDAEPAIMFFETQPPKIGDPK
ncbi:MAG: MarR family winged helix-turn-helix transcriptional regulator [bacterium]